MSIGSKKRRRVTSAPRPASMVFMPLSEAQRVALEVFFYETLQNGILPFDMPHPFSGTLSSWQFAQPGGELAITPNTRSTYRATLSLELLS
jgi:hypothetical protein